MRRQHVVAYRRVISVAALACSATPNTALAQAPTMMGEPDNWMVTTPSTGACLGLVLQVIRYGNNLRGFAATGDMTGMSRLTGSIDANGQFTITMTQVDGKGPQGTITGGRDPSNGGFLAQVSGSGCTDGPLKIVPYAQQ
jgi:hypothetical protein